MVATRAARFVRTGRILIGSVMKLQKKAAEDNRTPKIWRNHAASRLARQRFGVRLSSAALDLAAFVADSVIASKW